ncbi:hypothetical protein FRC12_007097 [Ceratobasidium sp. 428]|nr:hypothetical protein FRC12_007097 [Ceratobasidium sp. 428]
MKEMSFSNAGANTKSQCLGTCRVHELKGKTFESSLTRCLVVWDTVSSIFTKPASSKDANLLGIPDSELPPNVEHALHAMAFHENRRLFRATLFKPNNNTKLREIWFPGAHADVGGGGKFASDLPNISLLWVISEMATYLHIPIPDLEYPDLNTLIPTDAYHDSSACRRLLDRCETRLESKLLKSNSFIHETVAYLHNTLPSSLDPRPKQTSHILTLQDLSAIQWDIKAYLWNDVLTVWALAVRRVHQMRLLPPPQFVRLAYPDRMPPAPIYYPLTQEKQPLQGYLMSKTVALAPSHIHPIGIILLK